MNEYKRFSGTRPKRDHYDSRDEADIKKAYHRNLKHAHQRRPNPKPEKEVRPLSEHMRCKPDAENRKHTPAWQNEVRERQRHKAPFSLHFRAVEPGDFNFVLNSWMVSYRNSRRDLNNEVYFGGQQNLIAALAKRRRMVIACDGDEPAWIAGFICAQMLQGNKLLLDYIYVKQAYRERGIGRGLLAAVGWDPTCDIIGTHRTYLIEPLWTRFNATYNDYFNKLGYSSV